MRKCLAVFSGVVYAVILSASGVQSQHVTKISASQLVTNGESFFASSNITSELTRLARADGYIASNESFKCIAYPGVPIATVLTQYKDCNPKPKYLISDGGGIDLMQPCPTPVTDQCTIIKNCKATLQTYLDEMKKNGTKKLLWMIYPDPVASKGWATLKANQDVWAQVVPPVINACTDPKTLLVDLRPVWAGHYDQYTQDGIHCTTQGGTATAEAFWKAMKENYFFDTGNVVSTKQPANSAATAPAVFRGQHVSNNSLLLSLSLDQPATDIAMRITTISGRTILTAAKQAHGTGLKTVEFPLGSMAHGVYCLIVRAGQLTKQSALLVP